MTRTVALFGIYGHKRALLAASLFAAVTVIARLRSIHPQPGFHVSGELDTLGGARLHRVGTSRVLAFSAYLDARGDGRPLVRVFALAPRSPLWRWRHRARARCVLFGSGPGQRTSTVAAQPMMLSNHYNFRFAVFNFLCRVPEGESPPGHVALVMDEERGDEGASSVPMLVYNREPSAPEHRFGVCLPTLFGGFGDVLLFLQSVESYRLLGAGFITVYNSSVSPELDAVLRHYARSGFVDLQQWPIGDFLSPSLSWDVRVHPGDLHYYGQIATVNDCVYRNMYRAQYLAVHDVDEIIVPRKWPNWAKMMEALAEQGAAAYYFRMHNFPVTGTAAWTANSRLRARGTDILEHVEKVTYPPGEIASKVLLQPRGVQFHDVHRVLSLQPGYVLVRVPDSLAAVQHYKRWRQEWAFPSRAELTRDTNLLRYAGDIERAVRRTLDAISNERS